MKREMALGAAALAAAGAESSQGADWSRVASEAGRTGGRIVEQQQRNNRDLAIERMRTDREKYRDQLRLLEIKDNNDARVAVATLQKQIQSLNTQLSAMEIVARTGKNLSSADTEGTGMKVGTDRPAGEQATGQLRNTSMTIEKNGQRYIREYDDKGNYTDYKIVSK